MDAPRQRPLDDELARLFPDLLPAFEEVGQDGARARDPVD